MTNTVKVTNYTYMMIEKFFNADIVRHGFFVGTEQVGFMECVDQDEDRMYFDHYVREDFFNKYQEETK